MIPGTEIENVISPTMAAADRSPVQRDSLIVRICAALAGLTICALLSAKLVGLLPDRTGAVIQGRIALTESIAASCSLAARRGDLDEIDTLLQTMVNRNPTLLSAGFRLAEDGRLAVASAAHERLWSSEGGTSDPQRLQVPLRRGATLWGTIELAFQPPQTTYGALSHSSLWLVVFVAGSSFLGFFWYLGSVLRQWDLARIIPDRVRSTLDSLAEGLLVFDRDERIVMANATFLEAIGLPLETLLGRDARSLPWVMPAADGFDFPWSASIAEGTIQTDCRLRLRCDSGVERVFKVNTAPILSESGANRGALATFSDVTELELRNTQLHETLAKLERSREQIRQHNEQLRTLATRDPLTGCLNRRAFFEEAEKELRGGELQGYPISYVIFDVDHFKAINDGHGHCVGDEVLRQVGKLVESRFEQEGIVCRYGGEEFSVLLPRLTSQQAAVVAEDFCRTLEQTLIADMRITASGGVAELSSATASGLREVMERADRALYAAKRGGRNQVKRADKISQDEMASAPAPAAPSTSAVPFTAVTALCSALYYRDPLTAEHSRRVANLAVAAARGMMSEEKRYLLEVAALLHDIGKLGVPDAVLHKPGELTSDEWNVMKTYERVGNVILENAFTSHELAEITRNYRIDYCDAADDPDHPLPITARLLKIADAYDSMTHRKAYRPSLTQEEAFQELRNCAGRQFDPDLVEHFIEVVGSMEQPDLQPDVDRRAALQLGLETERLACALDARDRITLRSMVARLKALASENGLHEIRDLSEDVEQLVAADAEWLAVLGTAVELLDTCRMAQWACVVDQQAALAGSSCGD